MQFRCSSGGVSLIHTKSAYELMYSFIPFQETVKDAGSGSYGMRNGLSGTFGIQFITANFIGISLVVII